jgi:hypothetical protein
MKLAAMQPYFFPYLGYFDLLNIADVWIVYDVAQYMRHGWVNRNRVLHPVEDCQYIILPLKKHHYTTPINEIVVANEINWQKTIFRQLEHYHMDAPYYHHVIDFLKECFSIPCRNLAQMNTQFLRLTAGQLGIETPIHVFSQMSLSLGKVGSPEELALGICQAVGASEYINPPGGAALYSAERFSRHGIKLYIQEFKNMPYQCGRFKYQPSLSIIDVMMWNSCEKIREYLDTFRSR